MHGFHHGENDLPERLPGSQAIHLCGFFQHDGDVFHVPCIQHDVHGHVEHQVQQNDAELVAQVHLRGLLDQGHHQNGEGNKHSADDVEVHRLEPFAAVHAAAKGIPCQGIHKNCQDDGPHGNEQRVSQRMPEVRDAHGFREVRETPGFRERQRAFHAVGHFGRLLEGNYDGHVQREEHRQGAQAQYECQQFVLFHQSCSSLLLMDRSWITERATITTKKNTALALWNPNCPPSRPLR